MTIHSPLPRPAFDPSRPVSTVSVTLRLADFNSDVLVRHVRLLRDCVALAQKRWGFAIEAAAVMPQECQLLCRFQGGDFGAQEAVRMICSAFDRHVPAPGESVWADDVDMVEIAAAVVPLRRAFIENAPVRAGLVATATDWPFSSVHSVVVQGSDMGVAVA